MIDLYKIHPDTFPFTNAEASNIANRSVITDADTCTWIPGECNEPAVRLGTFTVDDEHFTLKFLCERHKQMGLRE